jgi:hypothetical protein
MLLILKVVLLIGLIIIPLRPQKNKTKRKSGFKIDSNTKSSEYAINENGDLEKINRIGVSSY